MPKVDLQAKTCSQDATIKQVMNVINTPPAGFCFLVDDQSKLKGIVTDGDIRRWLLADRSIDQAIPMDEVPEPITHVAGQNQADALAKLSNRIRILPVVDQNRKVIDYYSYDERVHIPVATPDLRGNEVHYVMDALLSTWISSSGKYIDLFEKRFSEFIGVKHGIATSNGTTAISLALAALEIGPGDEVIVPDLTFAATINPVLHLGATPVIVDIESESWCMDPQKMAEAITPKTRAVIPVHLYGQPCNMDAIASLCDQHNIAIVEDCAEAHGARYKQKMAGSYSAISCYSFFGNKLITTGEGGMCLTSSDELNEKMRVLRDHGMNKQKRYWHDVVGYNFRMTNIQAAIGCAQLERVQDILNERETIESNYREALQEFPFVQFQPDLPDRERVVWLVSILLKDQNMEQLIKTLQEDGIDARRFFYPLSSMPIYQEFVHSNKVSSEVFASGLNLPTHIHVDSKRVQQSFRRFSERT